MLPGARQAAIKETFTALSVCHSTIKPFCSIGTKEWPSSQVSMVCSAVSDTVNINYQG